MLAAARSRTRRGHVERERARGVRRGQRPPSGGSVTPTRLPTRSRPGPGGAVAGGPSPASATARPRRRASRTSRCSTARSPRRRRPTPGAGTSVHGRRGRVHRSREPRRPRPSSSAAIDGRRATQTHGRIAGGNGSFTVAGSHTYRARGPVVTVTIPDLTLPANVAVLATTSADVSGAPRRVERSVLPASFDNRPSEPPPPPGRPGLRFPFTDGTGSVSRLAPPAGGPRPER